MKIDITRTERPVAKPLEQESQGALGFGRYFSDHMLLMDYTEEEGWHHARIEPYHDICLNPAAAVLHYGQEIFEGMKAYRAKDGRILLFRVAENARRFNQSAERMCMPQMDEQLYAEVLRAIVDVDRDWTPHAPGTSLVLRPAMIALDPELGVHPSKKYLFFIICSPSGAYFKNGMKPVSIYVEDQYIRAARGGTGYAKTGGNYAGSMKAGHEAASKGFDQVLWLDGVERKYVEEVGAMNIMFVIDDVIVTPPLAGTILPGVTRSSILQLARDAGWKTEERRISIDEVYRAHEEGRLSEAFGAGTAAIVAPVGKLNYQGHELILSNNETGPKAKELYQRLVDIQLGDAPDAHGWVTVV